MSSRSLSLYLSPVFTLANSLLRVYYRRVANSLGICVILIITIARGLGVSRVIFTFFAIASATFSALRFYASVNIEAIFSSYVLLL